MQLLSISSPSRRSLAAAAPHPATANHGHQMFGIVQVFKKNKINIITLLNVTNASFFLSPVCLPITHGFLHFNDSCMYNKLPFFLYGVLKMFFG
jgi:hypothetical protein